jgi:small subunit ribosomal protein S20
MAEKEEAKKVKRPTPLKRDMQNEKKRVERKGFRSRVLTAMRTFEEALSKSDATAIQSSLKLMHSLVDKGVKTGIFKLNKASRMKSRLSVRATAK